MNSEQALDELLPFLSLSTKPNLRQIAAQHILALTSSDEGRALIMTRDDCLEKLISLSGVCDDSDDTRLPILQSIVNLSTDDDSAEKFLSNDSASTLVSNLLRLVNDVRPQMTGEMQNVACMALSNLTRMPFGCRTVWKHIASEDNLSESMNRLMIAICRDVYSVNHLAMFLCNLSQLEECRRQLMDEKLNLLVRLLPLLNYTKSDVRRRGVVGIVRNCCFDTDRHDWLLSDEIGLLTALVYPLAGPEEFDDDEMSQLPLELQYLGDDKLRESDPEIRKMLLESLNQLCAKREGREYIRGQRIYLIMRELHKWETIDDVVIACENLVDILIGDEPSQPEFENLKEVTIPEDLIQKFDRINEDLMKKDSA